MKTDSKFTVIGNPVNQSLSPDLHSFVFELLNFDYDYSKIEIEPEYLSVFINKTRVSDLIGFNVTAPHKETIIGYLDRVDPIAKTIGAVNCVKVENGILTGHNTDWIGFLESIRRNQINLADRAVTILGSGGVSKAILYALSTINIEQPITVVYRSKENCEKLLESVKEWNFRSAITVEPFNTFDNSLFPDSVIVNCTPVGMFPDSNSPIPKSCIKPNQIVIDTIYNPSITTLLTYAKDTGAKYINGLEMFIVQGLTSLNIWLNRDIQSQIDFPEIYKHLEQKICYKK